MPEKERSLLSEFSCRRDLLFHKFFHKEREFPEGLRKLEKGFLLIGFFLCKGESVKLLFQFSAHFTERGGPFPLFERRILHPLFDPSGKMLLFPAVDILDHFRNIPSAVGIDGIALEDLFKIFVPGVVAISGEWFTAHGVGENLGHVLLPENKEIMDILRAAFAAWYDNGHTNEADPNTCLLKIRLTDGVLFSGGIRYEIEFT